MKVIVPQPPRDWRNEPCTKLQREYIENRRNELRMDYPLLIKICCVYTVNPVTDIGQLTKNEAAMVLNDLIEMCSVRERGKNASA